MSHPFQVNLGIPNEPTSVILDQLALQTKYGTDPELIGFFCTLHPKCPTCGQECYINYQYDTWCANLACKDNTGDLRQAPPKK
jgi:hypothetical protein